MSGGHRLFRGVMWVLLLAPVLLLVAWFVFLLTFDFNAHRKDFEAFFARNVPGYQLTLAGEIEVSPWPLRIQLGPGAIYTQDERTGDYLPVVHWRSIRLEMDVWRSLQAGRWHFNEIALQAPSLHWIRRRQGDSTVLPLLHSLFEVDRPLQFAGWLAPRRWQADSFQVVEGRVRWRDLRGGQTGVFRQIQVQLSDLIPGQPAMGAVSWEMAWNGVQGRVDFRGHGVLEHDVLRLIQWTGGIELRDPAGRQTPVYWRMTGQEAALKLDTLAWTLVRMTLMQDGQQVTLHGRGSFPGESASLMEVRFRRLDIPQWMKRWGWRWPATWQGAVWRTVDGGVNIQWSPQRVSLQVLPMRIGPGEVEGVLVFDRQGAQAANLRLALRRVALSLHAPSETVERAQASENDRLALPLPVKWFGRHAVRGTLTLHDCHVQGMPVTRGTLTLLPREAPAQLVLAPFDFTAWGGIWESQLAIALEAPWRWRWKGRVQQLDSDAWLTWLGQPETTRLVGEADVRFDLQGEGLRPDRWRTALHGVVRVTMREGQLMAPAPAGGSIRDLVAEARLRDGRIRLDPVRWRRGETHWLGVMEWSLRDMKRRLSGLLRQETPDAVRRYRIGGTLAQPQLQLRRD